MRNNNLWTMAVCMILFLVFSVATLTDETHQLIAILTAALVACVYMVCESRVLRANAPLRIIDEGAVAEKNKPPEGENE